MSVPGASLLADLADISPLSQPWETHTLLLAGRRMTPSVTVIDAYGDIDASNADSLTEYALAHAPRCRGLILDLRGLDFIGTEGFSALHAIRAYCALVGTDLAVVAGGAASRLLPICDPQGALPLVDTTEAALATFPDQLDLPPLRLITAGTTQG